MILSQPIVAPDFTYIVAVLDMYMAHLLIHLIEGAKDFACHINAFFSHLPVRNRVGANLFA